VGGGFGAKQGDYPAIRAPQWGDVSRQQRDASVDGLSNCFWVPRTYIGNTGYNRYTDWKVDNGLFDTHAMFFTSAFLLTKGQSLIIHGTYPRGRFMTIVSYPLKPGEGFTLAAPATGLIDVNVRPDPGSSNPFLPGANRDTPNSKRRYTVTVVPQVIPPPNKQAPNVLYAYSDKSQEGDGIAVLIREYAVDSHTPDLSGGTGIPQLTLKRADGTVTSNLNTICKQINSPAWGVQNKPSITPSAWKALNNFPSGGGYTVAPIRYTATGKWTRYWGSNYTIVGSYLPASVNAKIPFSTGGGQGSDIASAYGATFLSYKFGKVYWFHVKAPTSVATFNDEKRYNSANKQVRYFSINSEQSPASGMVNMSLYDESIPVDANGYMTIAVSSPQDRPKNAVYGCGVAWLNRGPGDGVPNGRTTYQMIIYRMRWENAKLFHQGWIDVPRPGLEQKTMGPYFPSQHGYTSPAGFNRMVKCHHNGVSAHKSLVKFPLKYTPPKPLSNSLFNGVEFFKGGNYGN
jgi:hypothetical protein